MTETDHIALGGLAALAHSSEGVASAMALGISNSNSLNASNTQKRMIVVKQGSLAQEVAMSDGGITRQVHIVVKNSPFQLQLALLDDTLNATMISLEATLIYDTDNPTECKEVKMMKVKPLDIEKHVEGSHINITARAKVLSSQMEDMLFKIRFVATNTASGDESPVAICDSHPIKVVSKIDKRSSSAGSLAAPPKRSRSSTNNIGASPAPAPVPAPPSSTAAGSALGRAGSVGEIGSRSSSVATAASSRASSITGLAAVASADVSQYLLQQAEQVHKHHIQSLDELLRKMHSTNEQLAAASSQTASASSSAAPSTPLPLSVSAISAPGLSNTAGGASSAASNAEEAFEKNFLSLITSYENAVDREEAFAKVIDGLTAAECDQMLQVMEAIAVEDGGFAQNSQLVSSNNNSLNTTGGLNTSSFFRTSS